MYSYRIINPVKEETGDGGAVLHCDLEILQDGLRIKIIPSQRFSEPDSIGKFAQDAVDAETAPINQQAKIDDFLLVVPTDEVSLEKSVEQLEKEAFQKATNLVDAFERAIVKKLILPDDQDYVAAVADRNQKFKKEYIGKIGI